MTCKDCKWFDPGIPTRPKGFCHYGICARDGEDVGSETPACDPWFEGVHNAKKEKDQPQATAGD